MSNLDASTSPYHTGPGDGMPWFALLNRDHSPRPAYDAISAMAKEGGELPALAKVEERKSESKRDCDDNDNDNQDRRKSKR